MTDFTVQKGDDGVAVITWDVPGKSMNVLTMEGEVTVEYDYCVQGDFMLVTPKTVGNVGSVTTGTILFTRQDG